MGRFGIAAALILLGSTMLIGLFQALPSFDWFSSDTLYKLLGPSKGLLVSGGEEAGSNTNTSKSLIKQSKPVKRHGLGGKGRNSKDSKASDGPAASDNGGKHTANELVAAKRSGKKSETKSETKHRKEPRSNDGD